MLRATGVASVTSFSSARGVYSGATRDASPGRAQAGSRRMLFTITSTALRSVPTTSANGFFRACNMRSNPT